MSSRSAGLCYELMIVTKHSNALWEHTLNTNSPLRLNGYFLLPLYLTRKSRFYKKTFAWHVQILEQTTNFVFCNSCERRADIRGVRVETLSDRSLFFFYLLRVICLVLLTGACAATWPRILWILLMANNKAQDPFVNIKIQFKTAATQPTGCELALIWFELVHICECHTVF